MIYPEKIILNINKDYRLQIQAIREANKGKSYVFFISQLLRENKRQCIDIVLVSPNNSKTEFNCWRNDLGDRMEYRVSSKPRTCSRAEFLDNIFQNHKEFAEWFIWHLSDYEQP